MKFNKVYIEITNRCNLHCRFCSKSKRSKRDMSVKEFSYIIEQISDYTNYVYLHVKGEPLLHPELNKLLCVCDNYHLRVNITTNGTLIKQYENILLAHDCIKKINFSLHSENSYSNYFSDIFQSSQRLSRQMTIVYRLWILDEHKLDSASYTIIEQIKAYYNLDEASLNNLLNKQNVKVSNNIYIDKDNEFLWPSLDNEIYHETGYCYALKTHLAILSNGDVIPCCLDGEGVMKLGNLHEQGMDTIITSERFVKLKKSFQDRKPCEELCKRCGFKIRIKK